MQVDTTITYSTSPLLAPIALWFDPQLMVKSSNGISQIELAEFDMLALRNETIALSHAVRNQVTGSWERAYLFFGLGDGTTADMLYIERGSEKPIEEVFSEEAVDNALFALHAKSLESGSEIRSGALVLTSTGSFDFEFGYEDILEVEDRLLQFLKEMRDKYFADRQLIRAAIETD